MAKEKLESFKVGEAYRAPVGNSKKRAQDGGAAKDQSASTSLGFTRIESVLENESPETISATLTRLQGDLQKHLNDAKTNKDKANATRALAAVERTADLLEYLFQTKAALVAQAQGSK